MRSAAEFLFAGAALLPLFLLASDEPALAALALVFLMVGGAAAAIGDPEAPFRKRR